jgi:hypothetical protein
MLEVLRSAFNFFMLFKTVLLVLRLLRANLVLPKVLHLQICIVIHAHELQLNFFKLQVCCEIELFQLYVRLRLGKMLPDH